MTIEVTDEMIYAFVGEPEITATDAHAIRTGLAAVLAIVERDYNVGLRWRWRSDGQGGWISAPDGSRPDAETPGRDRDHPHR